jgi:hypothetical protein
MRKIVRVKNNNEQILENISLRINIWANLKE